VNKFNGLRHGEEKIIAARSRDIPIVDSKITSLKKPLKLNTDGSMIVRNPVDLVSKSIPFRTQSFEKFGHIEIVVVSTKQPSKNVAINFDPEVIRCILLQRFARVEVTIIKTRKDLDDLAKRQPDLVFSGVKYFNFDNQTLWLNEFLDQNQIPYIGSEKKALDREFNKTAAKKLTYNAGLKTALYASVPPGEFLSHLPANMQFPVFIKPACGGDSIGIDAASLAHNALDMESKIQQLSASLNCEVLVEQYLSGKEYSVGIIENDSTKTLTAMPIEIRTSKNKQGHRILDFQTKQNDAEEVLAVFNRQIHGALSDLAKSVFRVLGGSAFGRIDIRMCASGIPHFMEANLMPGLKKGYFYRACALNLGMTYDQMIIGLAENRIRSSLGQTKELKSQRVGTVVASEPLLQPI
jgi:D-alanine-D-alanine ligase